MGFRRAFTLMEVMVAVMIVSVVIAALLELRGNTNHLFFKLQGVQNKSYLSSFLLWNRDYGLQKSNTNLYSLVDDFLLDDEVRRELKDMKVTIEYKRLRDMGFNDFNLEIGRTVLQGDDFEVTLKRISRQ